MNYAVQYIFPSSKKDQSLLVVALLGFLFSLYLLIFMEGSWVPPDASPIGNIFTQGTVKRRFMKSLQWWNISNTQPLYRGDSIYTPNNTDATVQISGHENIFLGPNSLIKFDESQIQYIDLVLMRGTFEIQRENTKVKIAGQGARIQMANNLLNISASDRKDKIKISVEGDKKNLGKTTEGLSIELPKSLGMSSLSKPKETSRNSSPDATSVNTEALSEVVLLNDDANTEIQESFQKRSLTSRLKLSPAEEISPEWSRSHSSRKVSASNIDIIQKPLPSSAFNFSGKSTFMPKIILDPSLSKRPLYSKQPHIDLDAKTANNINADPTFLSGEPSPIGELNSPSLSEPSSPKGLPPNTNQKIVIPLDKESPEVVAERKMSHFKDTLEKLKNRQNEKNLVVENKKKKEELLQELKRQEQISLAKKLEALKEKKQKLLTLQQEQREKREAMKQEKIRLAELQKQERLQRAEQNRQEKLRLAELKKQEEFQRAEQNRLKELRRRELLEARQRTQRARRLAALKNRDPIKYWEKQVLKGFDELKDDTLVLKASEDSRKRYAAASPFHHSTLSDSDSGDSSSDPLTQQQDKLFFLSSNFLYLNPGLYFARLNTTDNSTQVEAKLVSNPTLTADMGIIRPILPRVLLQGAYSFSTMTFKETATERLSQPTLQSELKLASIFELNPKMTLRTGLAYSQRTFIRAESVDYFVNDNLWIFKMMAEVIFKLVQMGTFFIDFEGGAAVLMPRNSPFYSIDLGFSEFIKFTMNTSVSSFNLRTGLGLYNARQNTSLSSHSLLATGVDISVIWFIN